MTQSPKLSTRLTYNGHTTCKALLLLSHVCGEGRGRGGEVLGMIAWRRFTGQQGFTVCIVNVPACGCASSWVSVGLRCVVFKLYQKLHFIGSQNKPKVVLWNAT